MTSRLAKTWRSSNMHSIKCRCGVFTQNGFLCVNCQKDGTIDTSYYEPEEEEDEVEDIEEMGFSIVDGVYEEDSD